MPSLSETTENKIWEVWTEEMSGLAQKGRRQRLDEK